MRREVGYGAVDGASRGGLGFWFGAAVVVVPSFLVGREREGEEEVEEVGVEKRERSADADDALLRRLEQQNEWKKLIIAPWACPRRSLPRPTTPRLRAEEARGARRLSASTAANSGA